MSKPDVTSPEWVDWALEELRRGGIPSQHIGRTLDQLNRLCGNAGRVPAAQLRPHNRD